MRRLQWKRRDQEGFTFIEVMVVAGMLAGVLGAVSLGIQACHRATNEMERKAAVTRVASDLMDRLFNIDFGNSGDAAPTGAQLTELFDDDADLGTASLTGMRLEPTQEGYNFTLANFPYNGQWTVRVGADLNLDSDETDEWEGRDDLLRIDVFYAGSLVLSSMRTREVS